MLLILVSEDGSVVSWYKSDGRCIESAHHRFSCNPTGFVYCHNGMHMVAYGKSSCIEIMDMDTKKVFFDLVSNLIDFNTVNASFFLDCQLCGVARVAA